MKSVLLAIVLFLTVASASGPIAVYALVDKVSFEPDAEKPVRILISGVFITSTDQRSDAYSEPQRGYLYCGMMRGNEDLARREWNDLKSIAGSRQVVGLGSSWFSKVRVRKADEKPQNPDEYPMGNGLVRVNADQPRAKALLEHK